MAEPTHIGLDVHKETIAVAVLRPGGIECDERVIPNTPEALRKLLGRFDDAEALRVCYEAGPTGYDTQRLLTSLGIDCEVIAPSLVPRRSGVRVKTDRLDARNLARLHRAGELTRVRVSSAAEEALRDLVQARESLKGRPPHRPTAPAQDRGPQGLAHGGGGGGAGAGRVRLGGDDRSDGGLKERGPYKVCRRAGVRAPERSSTTLCESEDARF
jgi:hypothetical protein